MNNWTSKGLHRNMIGYVIALSFILTAMSGPTATPALAAPISVNTHVTEMVLGTAQLQTSLHNPTGSSALTANSVVRKLCSNANLYTYYYYGGSGYLRKVHAGRGFRVYVYQIDYRGRLWAYGHSAEAPTTNGWILESHLCK